MPPKGKLKKELIPDVAQISDACNSNKTQEIDLFRSFFRTKPSILTTVLPNSILYSLQDSSTNGTKAEEEKYDCSPQILDPHLKKNGVEYVRESGRFRFLASNIAENFSDKVPVTVEVLKSASRVIRQNADAERRRRSTITRRNQTKVNRSKKKKAKKENQKKRKTGKDEESS